MFVVPSEGDESEIDIVAVTKSGFGKRVPLSEFRSQKRAGQGVFALKFKSENDRLLTLSPVSVDDSEILLTTSKGTMVRLRVTDISQQSRMATGVKLQTLDPDDYV